MLEVLLVFSLNGQPEDISDRIFNSFEECEEFVNMLVGEDVVNSDYAFSFLAADGVHFSGQCIELKDWASKQEV